MSEENNPSQFPPEIPAGAMPTQQDMNNAMLKALQEAEKQGIPIDPAIRKSAEQYGREGGEYRGYSPESSPPPSRSSLPTASTPYAFPHGGKSGGGRTP
jgi:hypothetical protein